MCPSPRQWRTNCSVNDSATDPPAEVVLLVADEIDFLLSAEGVVREALGAEHVVENLVEGQAKSQGLETLTSSDPPCHRIDYLLEVHEVDPGRIYGGEWKAVDRYEIEE